MRAYETATIWSTSLSDSDLEKELARVQEIISKEDGTFRSTDSWGRRQLAYPIRKQTEGFYVFLIWDGDDRVTAGIDKYLRINEACLRYLTLRRDRLDDVKAPAAPVADSKRAAAPAAAVEEPAPVVEDPADTPEAPAAEPTPEEEKTPAVETAAEPPVEDEKSTASEAAETPVEEPETAPEAEEESASAEAPEAQTEEPETAQKAEEKKTAKSGEE